MTWPLGSTLRTSDPEVWDCMYYVRWEVVLACRGGHRSNGIAVFGHVEENCDCYHIFPEVPSYFSKMRASCMDMLCLSLNPNWSSRISPRSLTSCKILSNRNFSNSLPVVSKRLMGW
jgi:hypothetical protein